MSECHSFGSNNHCCSQSRKISVGVLVDSLNDMKSIGISQALKQIAVKTTSGKENLVENRAQHTPYTEDLLKDLQNSASPWVSTKSFNTKFSSVAVHDVKPTQNIPAAAKTLSRSKRSKKASVDHHVQPLGSKSFGLESYKDRLYSFGKASSSLKDGKVSNAENAENLSSKTGLLPEKDLAEDRNRKTVLGGSETLRMKLWEVIGNDSSPEKQHPRVQHIKIGTKDFNPEHEVGKENPKEKTDIHSDTIESDSERPDDILRIPLTHTLTRKKASTIKQHRKIEATKFTSHKIESPEKSTVSVRGDSSRRQCETVSTGFLPCNSLRNKGDGENFENSVERRQSPTKSKSILPLKTSLLQDNKAENGHSSDDRRRDILGEIESGTKIRNSFGSPNNVITENPSAVVPLRVVETPTFKIPQEDIMDSVFRNKRDHTQKPRHRTFEIKSPFESSPGFSPLGLQEKHNDLCNAEKKIDTKCIAKILLNYKSTGSISNGQMELSNGCGKANDYPPLEPSSVMEKDGEHSISGSSNAATDSENSEDDFHTKGPRKLEPLSPEVGIAEHFLRSRRLSSKKGVGVTGCSPMSESLKGNEESGKGQMCMELDHEDGFASAVALLTVALHRVQTKMKSVTDERSTEILVEAADWIHLHFHHIESQTKKDAKKLIDHSKLKRRHLDARFQEQHEQLIGMHKRFESEVHQHLQGYEHLIEDLEEFGTELAGSVKRHKASNEKFLSLAEQAIKVQLADAERKILAAQELARQKMLPLKLVVAECLKQGAFAENLYPR